MPQNQGRPTLSSKKIAGKGGIQLEGPPADFFKASENSLKKGIDFGKKNAEPSVEEKAPVNIFGDKITPSDTLFGKKYL